MLAASTVKRSALPNVFFNPTILKILHGNCESPGRPKTSAVFATLLGHEQAHITHMGEKHLALSGTVFGERAALY
jgi:hypothetical protein